MKRFSIVILFILAFSIISVDRLGAVIEADLSVSYVYPFESGEPFVGFAFGLYFGLYEVLPVHFGIRFDYSFNLVENKDYSDDSFYDIRMPLFFGLRISYPISFFVPYIEIGPEGSVGERAISDSYVFAENKFNFNFGGGFGVGFNFHLGTVIVGVVFRYHLHVNISRHYFTTGLLFGLNL